MSLFGGARIVGAYVCPRGAFIVECKRSRGGMQIGRTLELPAQLESAVQAADHLVAALAAAGIRGGQVALAIRGFGFAYHVLQMPPAKDEMLSPIIEREVRRLEPQLGASVVSWSTLPPFEAASPEAGPQRSVMAAAAPTDVIEAFERRLRLAGYKLLHVTALASAMQRLLEEFEVGGVPTAMVAALPDGGFLGFALNGALRLIVEPPLPQDAEHEATALAEELELGVMFVRQQFRGAQIDRVMLAGSKESMVDAESILSDRLKIPVERLAVPDLSPAALAALGAMLDAFSVKPLSLAGTTRERSLAGPRSALESVSLAAAVMLALLAVFTLAQAFRGKQAADALRVAQRRVEQDSFGLAPLRATAGQRKRARDAASSLRLVADDRAALQLALTGIADVARPPLRVDSLQLARIETGWSALLTGIVAAQTNARAVETLHEFYRQLPQRLPAEALHLDELSYMDSDTTGAGPVVRFRMSFAIRTPDRD